MTPLDAIDRSIVKATQAGLPLTPAPYAEVAAVIGLTEAEVIERIAAMQERGIIRRIAIAPHHYALGMTANGMSVWDVDDDQISALGARIGALPYVDDQQITASITTDSGISSSSARNMSNSRFDQVIPAR